MAARKTQVASVGETSERQEAEIASYPHAVESPYRAGWEHALTAKFGIRGKQWTSTKSEPQWTVRFKNGEAASWFKDNWRT